MFFYPKISLFSNVGSVLKCVAYLGSKDKGRKWLKNHTF